jgi:prevent-host-death family protein
MNAWTVAEAKARFSQVINQARSGQPQTITKNGHAAVVIVSVEEWRKKSSRSGNLAEFFAQSPLPGSKLKISRSKGGLRQVSL